MVIMFVVMFMVMFVVMAMIMIVVMVVASKLYRVNATIIIFVLYCVL